MRILLVDDAEEMRVLVAMSLRLSGDFDVVGEAANGRDAVTVAGDVRPDVVLLDLSMPEMDGLEALPRIRAASPGSAVVVFSGFEESHLGAEARRLGARGYIEKGTPLDRVGPMLLEMLHVV